MHPGRRLWICMSLARSNLVIDKSALEVRLGVLRRPLQILRQSFLPLLGIDISSVLEDRGG
jgi:hypothetical protein